MGSSKAKRIFDESVTSTAVQSQPTYPFWLFTVTAGQIYPQLKKNGILVKTIAFIALSMAINFGRSNFHRESPQFPQKSSVYSPYTNKVSKQKKEKNKFQRERERIQSDHYRVGEDWRERYSALMAEGQKQRIQSEENVKLFVGQVPKHMTETQLLAMFKEFALVDEVNIIKDKITRASRGSLHFARESLLFFDFYQLLILL